MASASFSWNFSDSDGDLLEPSGGFSWDFAKVSGGEPGIEAPACPAEPAQPPVSSQPVGFSWRDGDWASQSEPEPPKAGKPRYVLASPLRLVFGILGLLYVLSQVATCATQFQELIHPKYGDNAYTQWSHEHGTLQELNDQVNEDYENWKRGQPDVEALIRQDLEGDPSLVDPGEWG